MIDGDIVAFRAAASCLLSKKKQKEGQTEPESVGIAISRGRQCVQAILEHLQTQDYLLFLSGADNFRYDIYPAYKQHRKDVPKPPHLNRVREDLLSYFRNTIISENVEADDDMIIHHDPDHTILCSNDKDFKANGWGKHYNFTLDKDFRQVVSITPGEMDYNFMIQMLMGDKADNIIGPFGFQAKVTVQKHLDTLAQEGCIEPQDIIDESYKRAYGDEADKIQLLNYRLLRLLRSKDELATIYEEKNQNKYPCWESEGEESTEESSSSNTS